MLFHLILNIFRDVHRMILDAQHHRIRLFGQVCFNQHHQLTILSCAPALFDCDCDMDHVSEIKHDNHSSVQQVPKKRTKPLRRLKAIPSMDFSRRPGYSSYLCKKSRENQFQGITSCSE